MLKKTHYIIIPQYITKMSRLAFRAPSPIQEITSVIVPTTHHHIVIEATMQPVGSNKYQKNRVEEQGTVLQQLRKNGKDIFDYNETRQVTSASTTLYQTTETYGTSMSIENIIETLRSADLTLRVNFNRPGKHSNTTCMALSSETLTRLIATNPDSNGNKIAELRVAAEQSAAVPSHGSFYIAITQKGTQHYLSHVDYKILTAYDQIYHN
tara:strand:- start:1327 stop:1956 length:630 start_codon:yes stop_codon:yes gene_type:complete